MKPVRLIAGAVFACTSAWALAQGAPESLLPPGFEEPAPRAPSAPPAAPRAAATAPASASAGASPVIQQLPSDEPASSVVHAALPAGIALPPIEVLERMSPEELEDALGLRPKFDIPVAARRSMQRIGVLDESEGGLPGGALAGQDASLVRATLAGNRGAMVSRWGHILLRRALASRLDAPTRMDPADFVALRAALLVRMGEGEGARALVQDIDTGNYNPALTQAAIDAYVATADFTGICPAVAIQGGLRKDAQWDVLRAICTAFEGEGGQGLMQLDRAMSRGTMPKIDLLLAQKYAGAAGKARRAVTVEWDDVTDMTPWRYALAIAVGLTPPDTLMANAGPRYDYMAATAPMLGLERRAAAADRAAGAGILSGAALVDLYGQIYANDDITGDWQDRASTLRDAYVAAEPSARLAAMRKLWDGGGDAARRYSRQVLTAYAAARIPVDAALKDQAGDLVASMLTAGLDRNALRWASQVENGSLAWAQLVLVAPINSQAVGSGEISTFQDGDGSENSRKTAFLVASLAGLGRISPQTANGFDEDLEMKLDVQTRWTRLIDQAAAVKNPALVALLAGVGMQGDSWAKMTPRYLYHIVSALRQVGLEAEARMIAAEAVARG